jgi:hypothetical protein
LALVVLLGQREREKLADPCQPRLTGDNAEAFHELSVNLFWNTHYEDYLVARVNACGFFTSRYKIDVCDGHPEWFRLWDAAHNICGEYTADDLDSAKLEKAWIQFGKPERIEDFVTAFLDQLIEVSEKRNLEYARPTNDAKTTSTTPLDYTYYSSVYFLNYKLPLYVSPEYMHRRCLRGF